MMNECTYVHSIVDCSTDSATVNEYDCKLGYYFSVNDQEWLYNSELFKYCDNYEYYILYCDSEITSIIQA